MDALPDDILLLILGRFDEAKELAQLALLSRRWWQLCKHVPALALRIPSSYSTECAERLLESVLSTRFRLRDLILYNEGPCDEILRGDEIVKSLGHHSSTIESLSLSLGSTVYTTIWTSLATEFPKLSSLDIKHGWVEQSPDGCLFRNLQDCRFYSVRGIDSASLEALLKACPALSTLSVFDCKDVKSRVSLDSKSLQTLKLRPCRTIRVRKLRMPSLKKLCLAASRAAGLFGQGSYGPLCEAEFDCVKGIFSATIEALVKSCPMLHTLTVSYCFDLRSSMSLESASLKDLSIHGFHEIEGVELRTCNLEKLSLQGVRRVTIYEEALNSIMLSGSCDVYAQPMRHLSKLKITGDWLKITGDWSCCLLKKVMSVAENISHLAIDAAISNIAAIAQDDLCQFSQLEQFYLAKDLLRVICARFLDANWEPPFFALKLMVIYPDEEDDDSFKDKFIMFVKGILKCSPSLIHLIVIAHGALLEALEEIQSDDRFHLKDAYELRFEVAYSELSDVIYSVRDISMNLKPVFH